MQPNGYGIAAVIVKHFTNQEETSAEQNCMVRKHVLEWLVMAVETGISFGMDKGGKTKGGGFGGWVGLVIDGVISIAEGAAEWEKLAKEVIERAHISSDDSLITDQNYSRGL